MNVMITPMISDNDGIQTSLRSDLAGPVFMNDPHSCAVPARPFSTLMATPIQFCGDLLEWPPLPISKFDDKPNDFHLGRIRFKASRDNLVPIGGIRESEIVRRAPSPASTMDAGLTEPREDHLLRDPEFVRHLLRGKATSPVFSG